MISSDLMFNKARPEWQPNAVLYAVDKDSLSYVKVPWDVEQTAEFAPWRLEPLTPQELLSDDGFKPADIQPADAESVAGALEDGPESALRAAGFCSSKPWSDSRCDSLRALLPYPHRFNDSASRFDSCWLSEPYSLCPSSSSFTL